MASMNRHHQTLDENGEGKCSVPMWSGGCPSGFCDAPAYGDRPACRSYYNHAAQEEMRLDGRYNGYVPGLACHAHGGPKTRVFRDGDAWCAVEADFVNLQESRAGFGASPEEARSALANDKTREPTKNGTNNE